jgi:hypothetical protein
MNISSSNNSYLPLEKVNNLQNKKQNLPKRKKIGEKILKRIPKRNKLARSWRITHVDSEISDESNMWNNPLIN